MWKSEGFFSAIFFGFDREQFYLRLDPDDRSQARPESCTLDLHVGTGGRQFRLSCTLSPSESASVLLAEANEAGTYRPLRSYDSIAMKKILELGFPFKDLEIEVGQEVRLSLTLSEQGMEVARYPHHNPVVFTRPGDDFEAAMWRV